MRGEQVPSLLQRAHRKLPRNGREVVQELVQSVATFEIVDQRLEGNARPDEDRLAAQYLRICMYDDRPRTHRDRPPGMDQV